ncbi:hypothetical protein LOAG_06539 [Loa loa]|uniref:Uncharacterized protein n=1 Tax=Loa loa TaxID=7209 RepID=A0A1S0TZG5_LOALO|nr:hypothetical protein LOAG_06539 [Loa loa]EFO21947.2 hypothetical protein LOAG_06539 [Loa loa]
MIAPVKESWSMEDLKTLPLVVDELNKIITNLNDLRTMRKLIAPTNLPDEKDITKLTRQAQKLCRIFGVDKTTIKSPISIIS